MYSLQSEKFGRLALMLEKRKAKSRSRETHCVGLVAVDCSRCGGEDGRDGWTDAAIEQVRDERPITQRWIWKTGKVSRNVSYDFIEIHSVSDFSVNDNHSVIYDTLWCDNSNCCCDFWTLKGEAKWENVKFLCKCKPHFNHKWSGTPKRDRMLWTDIGDCWASRKCAAEQLSVIHSSG